MLAVRSRSTAAAAPLREPLVRQPDRHVVRQSLDENEVVRRVRLGTP